MLFDAGILPAGLFCDAGILPAKRSRREACIKRRAGVSPAFLKAGSVPHNLV
jgi:hypothetical protein